MGETSLRIRGLLDKPSSKSFGMLGLAVESSNGALSTQGVAGPQPYKGLLDNDLLRDLSIGGHAIMVDEAVTLICQSDDSISALWIGEKFSENVPADLLPPLPRQFMRRAEFGSFWIAPSLHIWRVLDAWTIEIFRRIVRDKNEKLAKLMLWVAPDRIETRAAVWLTSTKEVQQRELNWWTRLEQDRLGKDISPNDVEARFERLVNMANGPRPIVVGFCAPAKGGDKDVAKLYSKHANLSRVGFGAWLEQSARTSNLPVERPSLQRLGTRLLEQHGALSLCLEVLRGVPGSSSYSPFVIEGIRHKEVLRCLKFLVGTDRFRLAAVDRPAAVRRRLLLQEPGITAATVDGIMDDPTELEIAELRNVAQFNLDGQRVEEESNHLLELVS